MAAARYSLVDYDSDEELSRNPLGPPRENLFAAADYIQRLCRANGVNWAFMGDFAMICRGAQRGTRDVDVATDATQRKIWEIIEPQPRLLIPDTRLVEGATRIFVKTGPSFGDAGCREDRDVKVELAIPGALGSPVRLEGHQDSIDVQVGGQIRTYLALDVLYMMKSKLRAWSIRAAQRDFLDIRHLLENYGAEVSAICSQLDVDDVEFFLNVEGVEGVDEQRQASYRKLFGR